MASEAKLNEKIITEFQKLRNEQRNLVNSLNHIEMDIKEHRTVIDTLKKVDEDRKCFRLIGGVLCERTVKEVLPQLTQNKEFLDASLKTVTEELSKKGQEINKFKEEHNIKIRGEQLNNDAQKSSNSEESPKAENRNVLVSSN